MTYPFVLNLTINVGKGVLCQVGSLRSLFILFVSWGCFICLFVCLFVCLLFFFSFVAFKINDILKIQRLLFSESFLTKFGCKTKLYKTTELLEWWVGSVVRALDWRSTGRVFESRQEHNTNFEFFRVKKVVPTRCRCAQPPCVYARIRKTMYAH